MPTAEQLWALCRGLDPGRAQMLSARFAGRVPEAWLPAAVLLGTAFPALGEAIDGDPMGACLDRPHHGLCDRDDLRRRLRIGARRARMRIALAEILPTELGGIGVLEAACRLSDRAEEDIRLAFDEAAAEVFGRLGTPVQRGEASRMAVLGMGKLGGGELNAGSDVDLCCFYDSDDCEVAGGRHSAHELWTKVVQRMTATLDDVTEDGLVWRVDLRLRPEGARGPLVNSVAAAERYYETFGRLWERAAFLRARPVAGDAGFGGEMQAMLSPFVWRKRIDPSIAETMLELTRRARAEHRAAGTNLKLAEGGIREAEMFVQALQLIWGGADSRLRVRPTLAAADRLRAFGRISSREADALGAAYTLLRRAEHAVQYATGVQTHALPEGADLELLARVLGFAHSGALREALAHHMGNVAELFQSLVATTPAAARRGRRWRDALDSLDRGDDEGFAAALERDGMPGAAEAARALCELARVPEGPLGAVTRERNRQLACALLDAVANSADPDQAARYLARVMRRLPHPELYARPIAEDPCALQRLVTVLGASAFLGEAVAARPELWDLLLFESAVPTPDTAREEVEQAILAAREHLPACSDEEEQLDVLVGGLRRAKSRVAAQVALADLGELLDTRGATSVLSALADATLEAATRIAFAAARGHLAELDEPVRGLAVVALGKLGGREIGYGSDLDVLFLYEPTAAPHDDPVAYFTRIARRIMTLISMPHALGRGYELDTRLRPSGSQGLLVTSLDAFARYHRVAGDRAPLSASQAPRAAVWERLTLLRARFAAGDQDLGARAMALIERAAYDQPLGDFAAAAADVDRLRSRMELELARERGGRFDIKFGRGGLMDVEIGVQLLQLAHGADPRVRTTDTGAAILALGSIGALDDEQADALGGGYAFLRRLELRLRIVHDDAAHLLEERAAGVVPLARRMGIKGPEPAAELMAQYRRATERIRRAFRRISGSAQP